MAAFYLMAALSAAAGISFVAAQQGQPQRLEAPKWLDDEGKELFYDLEGEDLETQHGDHACDLRKRLLGKMTGHGEADSGQHRARVLKGLGNCELKKGVYGKAKQRYESTISELGAPSDDVLMSHPESAHFVLIKQAAAHLSKNEVTLAGTALRRTREVLHRQQVKLMKALHKQMGQQGQAPPLETLNEELAGYGKTGQYLPMLVKQVPHLKQELPMAELVDQVIDSVETRLMAVDSTMKGKRIRLQSKGKTGSLLYVRALPAPLPVIPAEHLAAAQELVSGGATEAFVEEGADIEKGATLIKRAKEDKGCSGKGFDRTCAAAKKVADIASNGFGETKVLIVKPGKKTTLDACTTNANVGILVAAKDGASLTVPGAAEAVELKAGEPVVFDFCRESSVEASDKVPLLFAQAWHPEFAAVERTTELRARAKSFGLSEEEVKAAAKVVNDAAKKGWEKANALWRQSEGHVAIKKSFDEEEEEKMKKDEEAQNLKRAEDDANDEGRKKALEELEKKRAEAAERKEAAEAKRLNQKRLMEEERLKRDPWLNDPTVREAEAELEELKESRRDANAKLEFDLSTSLTKEISAQERKLKKVIKQAKKAAKKSGKGKPAEDAGAETQEKADEKPEKAGDSAELNELKTKLADVKKNKADAAEKDDFKTAKKLKAEQTKLEEKIKKLEL